MIREKWVLEMAGIGLGIIPIILLAKLLARILWGRKRRGFMNLGTVFLSSLWDSGFLVHPFPAINRWAIIVSPYGTRFRLTYPDFLRKLPFNEHWVINRVIGLCYEATDQIPLNPPLEKGEMTSFPAKFGITRLIIQTSSRGSSIFFLLKRGFSSAKTKSVTLIVYHPKFYTLHFRAKSLCLDMLSVFGNGEIWQKNPPMI